MLLNIYIKKYVIDNYAFGAKFETKVLNKTLRRFSFQNFTILNLFSHQAVIENSSYFAFYAKKFKQTLQICRRQPKFQVIFKLC